MYNDKHTHAPYGQSFVQKSQQKYPVPTPVPSPSRSIQCPPQSPVPAEVSSAHPSPQSQQKYPVPTPVPSPSRSIQCPPQSPVPAELSSVHPQSQQKYPVPTPVPSPSRSIQCPPQSPVPAEVSSAQSHKTVSVKFSESGENSQQILSIPTGPSAVGSCGGMAYRGHLEHRRWQKEMYMTSHIATIRTV